MKLSDGICKVCNKETETQKHLFLNCKFKAEWDKIHLQPLEEKDKMVFYYRNNIKKERLLEVNALVFQTKWVIWTKRNDVKHNNL